MNTSAPLSLFDVAAKCMSELPPTPAPPCVAQSSCAFTLINAGTLILLGVALSPALPQKLSLPNS